MLIKMLSKPAHNARWVKGANGMGDKWFEKEMEMIDENIRFHKPKIHTFHYTKM
jgi:hypothetical protein